MTLGVFQGQILASGQQQLVANCDHSRPLIGTTPPLC
jgi:hypothetical protein